MKSVRVSLACWLLAASVVFLSIGVVLGQANADTCVSQPDPGNGGSGNGDTWPGDEILPDWKTCRNKDGQQCCACNFTEKPFDCLDNEAKSQCRECSPAGVTLGYGESFAFIDDDGPHALPAAAACPTCGPMQANIPDASQLLRVRLRRIWHSILYPGSFGGGMYLTYDYTVASWISEGKTYIQFTDPNMTGSASGSRETFREENGVFVPVEWFGRGYYHTKIIVDPNDDGHITFVELGGRKLHFEWTDYIQSGAKRRARLEYIEDRNGNRISFEYVHLATNDTQDVLKWTTATDSYNRTLTFSYILWQGENVISEVTLPDTRKVQYIYDETINAHFVNKIVYGDGIESTLTYDPTTHSGIRNEALLSPDHYKQKTTLSTGGSAGRTRSIKRADDTFQYARTDKEEGNVFVTLMYDRGETFEIKSSTTKAIISEKQRRVDGTWEDLTTYAAADNRPTTGINRPATSDTGARVWSGARDDGNDRITSRTYPDSSSESFTYNQFAQMTSHIHRSGAIERWTYDTFGNMLRHTEAAGVPGVIATEKWTYNSLGQVLSHTDFRTNVTTYDYYANGDLHRIILPASVGQPAGAITYVYDSAGRIASVEDPVGREVNFEYDSAGRLTKTTFGDGSTEEMDFGAGDLSARLLSKKDRNGNLTLYTYDLTGRVLTEQVQQAGGGAILSTLTNTWDAPTGRLMAMDRDGDSTEYTYDYKGRILTTTVHPRVDKKLITRNAYDQYHLLSTTDPYCRTTFYLYDELDRVTRTVRETVPEAIADGTDLSTLVRHAPPNAPYLIEDYEYDAQGRQEAFVDGNFIRYEYEYDARNRRTLERSAVGTPVEAIEKYTYDRNNNLLSNTDKNNHVWSRTYTARDNILTDANPLQQKTRYTYYADGLTETMKNPNGHTTKYVYDICCGLESGGRLVELIDADLKVKRFEYDPNGNRKKVTDESGRVTTYAYDGLNRLIKTSVDPLGLNLQTTTVYEQTPGVSGRTETTTNPAGQVVTNNYDGVNRISTVTGETPHLTYTYDLLNASTEFLLKTTVTDANNNSRSNLTDGAGRTIKIFDGLNHATGMSYDNNSNLILVIDRDLRRTKYNYDARNRRTNMIADEGAGGINATTQYEYDPVGNLLGITDAEDKVTKYTYDNADRRLTATYAFGTTEAKQWIYTYLPLGQLRQITKPNDIVIQFAYDKPERLATRTYRQKLPNGTFMKLGVDTFTYHPNSLLKTAVGGLYNTTVDRSNLAVDYDGANRLLQERQNIGAGLKPISYTYHPDDLVNQITYPDDTPVDPADDIKVQHTYTNRRELEDVNINGLMQARHTYDLGGRRQSRRYANDRVTRWNYDADDRIASLNHLGVQAWNYRYTDEGDALVQDDQTTSDKGEAYAYDGMHRLVDHKRDQVVGNTVPTPPPAAFLQGWTLDKVGNWTAWNDNGIAEDRKHSHHHALTERKRNSVPLPQAYDPNLNQNDDGLSFLFEYDANDMLKRVRNRAFPNSVIAEYRYDALGRRVEKFLPGIPDNLTVRYYYSGDRIIEERSGSDAVTATYTYGDYIDEPLTMDRDLNNSGTFEANERFYYHSNRMYSTYALTNSAGNIVERYVYTPYGQATTFDASYLNPLPMSGMGNPFTFTGRELDAETGLMHYRARTYDTVQGRFKQRDPIEYAGGDANLYAYVINDPINALDPFGLESTSIPKLPPPPPPRRPPSQEELDRLRKRVEKTIKRDSNNRIFRRLTIFFCLAEAAKTLKQEMDEAEKELDDCLKVTCKCPPLTPDQIEDCIANCKKIFKLSAGIAITKYIASAAYCLIPVDVGSDPKPVPISADDCCP